MNSVWTCFLLGLFLGTGLTGIGVYKWDELTLIKAVSAQKSADTASCNNDKQITTEADNAIHQENAALNARIAALVQLPTQCVPVITVSTGKPTAKVKHKSRRPNAGVTAAALYTYSGQCEADRLQLNGLIDFVNIVWARKP